MLEQFKDIYEMEHVPFWQTQWFYVLVGLGIVCGVIWLLRSVVRRKKRLTPWDKALKHLRELKQLSDFNQGNVLSPHVFYSMMTSVLKVYLQERYNLKLVGKTDDEFVRFITDHADLPEVVQFGVRTVFDGVTFIKFAHADATQERMNSDLEVCEQLIVKTIPPRSEYKNFH